MNPEETEDFLEAQLLTILGGLLPLLEGTNPLFVPCELASKKPSVNYAELTHDNWNRFYRRKLFEVARNEGNLAIKIGLDFRWPLHV
jgi:hypothetical protein